MNPLRTTAREDRPTSHVVIPTGGELTLPNDRMTPPEPGTGGSLRPVVETGLAILLFLPAAPVIVGAALLIKLTSRGSFLYTQTRVGLGGRPFTIY